MEKFLVEGGGPLKGEVVISGAKNAAVAIIPAVILAEGPCVLENIPNISDVSYLFKILQELGARIRILNKTTVEVDASVIREPVVPYELTKNMRASYYFIGSLLGRYRRAEVAMPGGCNFGGVRPIDQHLKGFSALGAHTDIDPGGIINATAEELLGSHVYFDVVTVGATVNVMLAAVRAKGTTILENVAKEPHIVDLANFLNSMGADVRGAGTDVIKIHGVPHLHGATYSIIPDQIEAGTYMVAAAATGGDVLVKNVIPKHLESITAKLVAAGATVTEHDDSVRVTRTGPIRKISLKTLPHPGFPTDMQPQMTAMLAAAEGTSVVTEGVWDNRFKYVDELRRMGAHIQVDGRVAVVEGVRELTAAPVKATDLRAGAALIIAGLMASGVTEIEDIYHVERGYEDVVEKFLSLGANIRKVTMPDSAAEKAV
ncbi:MAG: UDP-N-acetylglucosamine 1-carboxyvinyltransferase [Oscillospiraceae bacterium]|nr:UDP-N-acetylglucosamine 1-carboxyvinyltransferase [Oscillospiraceae bacterium]